MREVIRSECRRLRLPPLEERPICSMVIPCLDEEAYIEAAVRGAMEQQYPSSRLEILVCDGGSWDATRTLLRRRRQKPERLLAR